ncbi:MAG: hypothetical protein ACLFM4_08765 [Phormidium sp.]|nr:MAG: hypothetical protein HLUCCO16_17755 [Phormidium sp. OSCR]
MKTRRSRPESIISVTVWASTAMTVLARLVTALSNTGYPTLAHQGISNRSNEWNLQFG